MIAPNSDNYGNGRKGAAGEMIVIADLLHRGYEVWRAVSGQTACDLVVEIHDKLYKVEVRSVARQPDGQTNSPGGYLSRKGHQILAVVDRLTGSIRYYAADGNLHLDLINDLPFPELSVSQALTLHLERMQQRLPFDIIEELSPAERADLRGRMKEVSQLVGQLAAQIPDDE